MTENEIAKIIVDKAFQIHTQLGPGLLEKVYVRILAYELKNSGLNVEAEKAVPIVYNRISFDEGYRTDLMIEKKVIVEVKSVEQLNPIHKKQLLTYLKLADIRLGLLINFGEELIKNGLIRIVNQLSE